MAEFNLPFGVRVAGNDPIDKDRYIAINIAARNSIVTNGRAHNGLQVYVESEEVLYILKGTTNSDWSRIDSGLISSAFKNSHDFHQAQQLELPFVDVSIESNIEALANDGALGGFHASIFVEEVGKWFAFSRSAAAKMFIYEDLDDLSNRTVIDISDPNYNAGVENAVYNASTGKIYLSMGDTTYTKSNTLIKEVDVVTNVVVDLINYNTGVAPGSGIVISIGGFIYTCEANYGFKINKFDTSGNFIASIPSGVSGTVGAHGWVMTEGAFYVSSFINYFNENWLLKVDLATFTVVDTFNYAIPGANTTLGTSIFTNQIAISGNFIYLPTENFNVNKLYKVNKDDLSDFKAIDVLKTSDTSNLYFAQELDEKIYYGGSEDTFGYVDINTGENVLLKNPFPYSINQANVSRDQLLVMGFDVYPVNNTAYVGKARFFDILKSSRTNLVWSGRQFSTAQILALDPDVYAGTSMWSLDEDKVFLAISIAQSSSGVAYWQDMSLQYNPTTNTFELPTDHSGVTLQLGEEIVINIVNTDSTALIEGDPQVVLSFGATINQNFHSVARAKASDIQDGSIFGISTTNADALIGEGKATVWGFVKGIDSTGSSIGEVWLVNDKLYVNGINGRLTRNKPSVDIRPVAIVMKVDVTTGMLFINTISSKKEDTTQSTAIVSRAYLTGDVSTPNITTFYDLNTQGKGSVIDEQMSVTVNDNSTVGYAQDFITFAFPTDNKLDAVARHGEIEYSHNSNGGSELLHMELYLADANGDVIDSGIGGQDYDYLNNGVQVIGDLGVKPIMVLHSPRMDGDSGDDFTAPLTGFLDTEFIILAGQRLRFHILAEKFGTAGGNKIITIKFGDQRESYIEFFSALTSSIVGNDSNVAGSTVTDALNNLLLTSAGLLKVEGFSATLGQTSFTTADNSLVDNNQWSVIVNGQAWNSRTSNISFTNGNISINHATGVITFHIPLSVNDQVIVKYN